MNGTIDPVKEAYLDANISLAEAYHRMSEIYEKFAILGFECTRLSGLDLALKWERISLESRRRYSDLPENIKAGENNIQRIKEKIKKCKRIKFGDDKGKNT